jgi:hypothetical protein
MTTKSKYVGSNKQRCKETELYTKKLMLIWVDASTAILELNQIAISIIEHVKKDI